MAYWLAEPIEALIEAHAEMLAKKRANKQLVRDLREPRANKNVLWPDPALPECHALIVGSGYGGSVAAMRLAAPDRKVFLFERGVEYALGDFPENLGEAPGHIRVQRAGNAKMLGRPEALFDFRVGEHITALVGNGLGGGSLINANVAIRPDSKTFQRPEWPKALRDDTKELFDSMARMEALLGVTCDTARPGKMQALDKLAGSLNAKCVAAPIAVTFTSGPNAVGISQAPCVRCGNCVTGCNVGAKNTLAMNLLPLAKARGAKLYTGATVLSVRPEPAEDGGLGWLVRYRRTATEKGPLHNEIHTIRASVVVLAAGTFGSTEILLRSQALGDLDCSRRLGEGFSGNGDALVFGYAQRNRVGCLATGGSLAGVDGDIGPTINGLAHVELKETGKNATRRHEKRVPGPWPRRMLLEDGAVPIILKRVFAELVAAGSLIRRHTKDATPAWFETHGQSDPLAIHPQALEHSQLLLAMGDDGAPGKLVLPPPDEGGWDDAHVAVHWRRDGADVARAFQRSLDAAFLDCEDAGFDGGDYVANPFAQPLPEDFDAALTGGAPPGMQVTVHPLGGCPMGEKPASGVVNHYGEVWRRGSELRRDLLYDGLHVLDGAIFPAALGVNPFLTIAALADRAASQILRARGWVDCEVLKAPLETPPQTRRPESARQKQKEPVAGNFKERLTGRLDGVPADWLGVKANNYPAHHHWLAADIDITIEDIDLLLENPGRAWSAKCVLREVPKTGAPKKLVEGSGTVSFFVRNRPQDRNEQRLRAWRAIIAFGQRRKPYVPEGDQNLSEKWHAFFRVAKNHADWRDMQYRFTFEGTQGAWILKGTKHLAYEAGRPNIWSALTELPVTAVLGRLEHGAGPADLHSGKLEVDLDQLTRRSPLQVTSSPNLSETLMTMIGTGMLFLRTLFQTHFWSFPAPEYSAQMPVLNRDPDKINVAGQKTIAPETVALAVPGARESVQIRLIRYANPEASKERKVLLIHGLAHGANVFTTETVMHPLAAYLYDRGLEPWLLEHRLSHALPGTAMRPSNMDDIAAGDIATAVEYLYRIDNEPIAVFAHCIGAGAFSMAVLGGHCHDATRPGSRIRSAVIHAVPPWVVPSRANRMRANLAAFVKDVIGAGALDPIPSTKDKVRWYEAVVDRIAGSLPWARAGENKLHLADGEDDAMGKDICNRMALFYGVEWPHENLDPKTHRDLASLLGVGNLEVFRHVFFLAQRGRITDRQGRNVYLTEKNVENYWGFPTLFAHGTANQVFDPQSSRRSAVRLKKLQGKLGGGDRSVFIHQVRGYGHLDFIFGRDAHVEVYPAIGDFLRGVRSELDKPTDDMDVLDQDDRPLCGPLIGDAQRVPRTEPGAAGYDVKLRVWMESNENESWPAGVPIFTLRSEPAMVLPAVEVTRKLGQYGLYLVYDIVVPTKHPAPAVQVQFRYDAPTRKAEKDDSAALINLRLPWFRRLAEASPPTGCSFLIGSCRHPGSPFERDIRDRVAAAMCREVERGNADHVLLVGDQIYADATADAFDTSEPGERFVARYRDLFQSKPFSDLASCVPIRMALDDHEISNNWPGRNRPAVPQRPAMVRSAELEDQRMLEEYEIARESAFCYEALGAPGERRGDALWYEFESGGLPFFVMDCRTERVQRRRNVRPTQAAMLQEGGAQAIALEKWLRLQVSANRDLPKFIVCSTPIAPVHADHVRNASLWRNADNWFGYPASLNWLASLFASVRPRNLVFLSGDYHFSATAELWFFDAACRETAAYQVVSSGLYAPMPFANERFADYNWDCCEAAQIAGTESVLGFRASTLTAVQSHFVRVDAKMADDGWHVDAVAIDADGKPALGADGRPVERKRLF